MRSKTTSDIDLEMANAKTSPQQSKTDMKLRGTLQRPATYIFLTSLVFLVYQIYLLQNSFSALYNIALTATLRWQATGSFWNLVWLMSESSGEVGLLLRFVGACLFIVAAWLLFREQRFSVAVVRKVVFLEATYFLMYIPFVVYLLTRPSSSWVGAEAGLSYALQMLLVSPSLFILYRKLSRFELADDLAKVTRWFALAFCSYLLALWVKGFLFAFYAVGIDFSKPVLIVAFFNSMVTLLVASLGALALLLPVIRGKRVDFNWRWLGVVLVCAGAYFVIFDLISLVNANYLNWVSLTEWWATSFVILGLFLIFRGKTRQI
jgi:hypothetical protein